MSDFERRREKNKEARDLVKIRRENIAKYFFDLSKLTFAALVLGLGGAFFNIGNWERLSYVDTIPLIIWYIFGVGLVATVWFAYIGSLILKID